MITRNNINAFDEATCFVALFMEKAVEVAS